MLVDCPDGVRSGDYCDADGPDLVGAQFLGRSARRAGWLFLLRDVMTDRTRFLGQLHFSSLMALAVSYRRGERREEPRVVMGA